MFLYNLNHFARKNRVSENPAILLGNNGHQSETKNGFFMMDTLDLLFNNKVEARKLSYGGVN